MNPSREHIRRLTYVLLDPVRARAAALALAGIDDPAAREGLCDLLADPPDEAAGVAAVRALSRCNHPQARAALRRAILSGSAAVRFAALHVLRCCCDPDLGPLLGEVLARDPSVRVRREAIRALPPEEPWPLLTALSDPVWRVRNDAVQRLLAWQRQDPTVLAQVRVRLASLGQQDRATEGAVRYLEFLATPGAEPPPRSAAPANLAEQPWRAAAWWDDDPPVLDRNLRHLTERQLKADLALLPGLLTLQDGRPVWPHLQGIYRLVLDALKRFGQPEHRVAALRLLDEPRRPLLASLLKHLVDDPPPAPVAISLTRERAELLWQQPELETSWRMLAQAADLLQRPLSEIAPPGQETVRVRASRRQPVRETTVPTRLHTWKPPPRPEQARALGRTGLSVSPLGLSGRYGLPERGFRAALEGGINLFFWEPGYDTQTRCWQRLAPSLRDKQVVVAGSFAADPRTVRRDLEQTLRSLRLERLGVFLLFWVRSPGRLEEETLETLEEMRGAGLVQALGLSTHLRPLALQAVRDGWDVLMIRHSLAHRGAEEELLPCAAAAETGILAFSSLCYGRLPQAPDTSEAHRPQAADCYRYTLSQPGISACLTAPRDLEQLRHNLQVLQQPTLDPATLSALRPWGDAVYRQHRAFVEWLRSR